MVEMEDLGFAEMKSLEMGGELGKRTRNGVRIDEC